MFHWCSFVESHKDLEEKMFLFQLEVHNSLWVEMKSATLICGQFPFRAPWQHEASDDTFVNAPSLYALEVDSQGCSLPPCSPPPHVSLLFPSLHFLSPPSSPLLPLPAFFPSRG